MQNPLSVSRTLEITIFSCEDLRIDQKLVKKNTYVVVRTDHLNCRTTSINTQGGGYPYWNEKLVLDMMPLRDRFLTLEARCKTTSNSDRIIATASIPVTDFMGGYLPDDYLNILSYRLKDGKGERNGIINLSVKVKVVECLSNHESKRPEISCSTGLATPNNGLGGVVTGIPVWGADICDFKSVFYHA